MQPFVVCSAFAGMTIPYPKREFLNDDDSDSKSSAAKVMKCYWVNLSNREINAFKVYPFYIILIRHRIDKIMTFILHLTKSCKVFSKSTCMLIRLIQHWSNFGPMCRLKMKIGELCACAIWCQNKGYACLFVSCMLSCTTITRQCMCKYKCYHCTAHTAHEKKH